MATRLLFVHVYRAFRAMHSRLYICYREILHQILHRCVAYVDMLVDLGRCGSATDDI